MKTKKRVLLTILNWGLGHATRCIPIIRQLMNDGHIVILASDGQALQLLKKEFPTLLHEPLPAHNIRYRFANMVMNILPQLPKIAWITLQEHQAVRRLVKKHHINWIISDNRFGCFHPKVHSTFMTHQVNIEASNSFIKKIIFQFNRFFIERFDELWIPDIEGDNNLGGSLSHNFKLNIPVKYLGILSRMQQYKTVKKYKIAAILSGPEPQRTFLENKLINELQQLPYPTILVRGLTGIEEDKQLNQLRIVSYMTSQAINDTILQADLVISRSGYSTIMDLVKLGAKAILIPTPGQTEQELLAQQFHEKKVFLAYRQDEFNVLDAIEKAAEYKGLSIPNQPKLNL